ncbi:MAG: UDP-3-O-acyl-N-acetylglucosamine deacetylase [Deltaproteobacteria bacterium]|nr:UDP-3-O-acyl-N-acetylglucosamine deacetylase [Deltaproteobacteria bacterium]
MYKQKTIKKVIQLNGKGLHSGKDVELTLSPSPVDYGIVFKRTDLSSSPSIRAHASNVVDTSMATTLGKEGVSIGTVEHLLSALMGLQVDNVHIDVKGPEIPVFDGSAAAFIEAIIQTGLKEQKSQKKFLIITKPVAVRNKDRFCYLFPSTEFKVTCRIEFAHTCIGKQNFDFRIPFLSYKGGSHFYCQEIAQARTFGFLDDVSYLQSRGLALGASLENAVVLDKDSIVNREGLRWQNEFVRHKVLDSIGDLALVGAQVIGHLITYRSGHSLHHQLVEKTLKSKDAWKMMTYDQIVHSENGLSSSLLCDQELLASVA